MSKKNKYEDLSNRIVELVGGKENIVNFTHCITRLRFNVKDRGLINNEEVESVSGVVGTQFAGDQYQIIIGQAVADAYNLICEKTGLGNKDEFEIESASEKKKFSFMTIIDYITGSIIPCLPILIGCGFIQVIVSVLELTGFLKSGIGTDAVLTFVGDAGFYFLPIFVGYHAAKKLKANPVLGMLLGAILVHPTLVGNVGAETGMTIYGLPITATSYTSSVFPILLSIAVMAPIQKFIAKHCPDMLRTLVEPLLTILIMLPIALCVLGPIGGFIGTYLTEAIIWLYNTTGFIGLAVFSCVYPLLVMTGMHTAIFPYAINQFATVGCEGFFLPAAMVASVNQGIAAFAVSLKSKNVNVKAIGLSSSVTAILSGVFEPALYGITLKYKTPLYAAMIGSIAGAAVAGVGRTMAYAMAGGTGLLTIPVFLTNDISNFVWMAAAVVIGAIVTFILAYIMYKED